MRDHGSSLTAGQAEGDGDAYWEELSQIVSEAPLGQGVDFEILMERLERMVFDR